MLRRFGFFLCLGGLSALMVVGCDDDELPPDASTPDSAVPDSAAPDAAIPDPEPYCGDGNVDPGEECDSSENCAEDCTLAPFCGDGNVDPTEECDGGENCAADCTFEPYCGDGSVDDGEECDDGNAEDGDGCAADCTAEPEPVYGLCEAAPKNACETCSCTACADAIQACKDVEGVAEAGPRAGTPRSELCQDLVICGQSSGCRGDACYCGVGVDTITCLTVGPSGPCIPEVTAAAESEDSLTISGRKEAPQYALMHANGVSTCTVELCADACQ